VNVAPGPEPGDTPMTARYLGAILLEALIILALYLLGRAYS
jgi:hypothetical protein